MREIVLDTETTGLDPRNGDRLVEIGCVELVNRFPTGRSFHVYINPERDMPEEAFRVHGLSGAFLADKPVFAAIAEDFEAFITDATLVIHNASFDVGFLDAELARLKRPPIARERVVDTLILARRRFPGSPNNLDALCARFGIDNSKRVKHGALVDAEILAEVYVELVGGRQAALGLASATSEPTARTTTTRSIRPRPAPLPPRLTEADREAHRAFVATLGPTPIWHDYLPPPPPAEPAT